MILEAVRIVADWLADSTNGVNALLASVPREADTAVPPAVTVFDSSRHGFVARGQIPESIERLPALLVSPADQSMDQVSPAARPFPADTTITLLVRYATQRQDTAQAERDASLTIRAIWRSIGMLMQSNATTEAARNRNSVQLWTVSSMQAATLYQDNQDTVVTGGVLVTCRVRDLWAIS